YETVLARRCLAYTARRREGHTVVTLTWRCAGPRPRPPCDGPAVQRPVPPRRGPRERPACLRLPGPRLLRVVPRRAGGGRGTLRRPGRGGHGRGTAGRDDPGRGHGLGVGAAGAVTCSDQRGRHGRGTP